MSTITEPHPAAPVFAPSRRPASRLGAGAVLATLTAAVGTLVALAGLGLVVLHLLAADGDGFYTTGDEHLQAGSHALVAEDVEVAGGAWIADVAGRVRVSARSTSGAPVFVGIARQDDVDRYLGGVAHTEVDDPGFGGDRPSYAERRGGGPIMVPGAQRFWVASATGTDARTLEWDVESGRWAVVVMNADGSRDVSVDVAAGARLPWLLPAAIGIGIVGLVLLGGGAAALAAMRRRG